MSIYFKFKNVKKWDTLGFDNAVISVLELKRGIVKHKKLDKTHDDFDLLLSNAQTGELYKDDAFLVPKNTSIIVKRIPAKRTRSLVIKAPPETQFTSEDPEANMGAPGQAAGAAPPSAEEQQMIELARNASAQQQHQHAGSDQFQHGGRYQQQHHHRGGGAGGGSIQTPPSGYVCYRCGVPGHMIQNCPTNGDPKYDIKKSYPPIGIPKSFLKPIDQPASSGGVDRSAVSLGEGKYAYVQPNERVFEQTMSGRRNTSNAAAQAILAQDRGPRIPKELECPICQGLLKSPTVINCCFTSFCEECIRQRLLAENHAECPVCRADHVSVEELKENRRLAQLVKEFTESSGGGEAKQVEEKVEESSADIPPVHPSRQFREQPPAISRERPREYHDNGGGRREEYRHGPPQHRHAPPPPLHPHAPPPPLHPHHYRRETDVRYERREDEYRRREDEQHRRREDESRRRERGHPSSSSRSRDRHHERRSRSREHDRRRRREDPPREERRREDTGRKVRALFTDRARQQQQQQQQRSNSGNGK